MKNNLGRALREAREELSRQKGREVLPEEIAHELDARGVPMTRKTYSNLETGRTRTIKAAVANELPKILTTITTLQIVQAAGFDVKIEGIRDEKEWSLVRLYRAVPPPSQIGTIGGLQSVVRELGLEVE